MDDVKKEKKNKLKLDFLKENKDNIINIIVFTIFIIVSLFVGMKHEPWGDEAQAWLIARDNNIIELLQTLRYEGTPGLWYFILKFLMLLGFEYKYFYLISVFFTALGIYLLLFKIKMPQIFKVLLPFSYFILYQFNIVSRSYCLILPILCCIAMIYESKKEKSLLYTFLLILLMNVSAHTYLIAGCFFIDFLVDIYMDWKKENVISKKKIAAIIITCLAFLITLIFVFPTEKGDFKGNEGESIFTCIANALFSSRFYSNGRDTVLVIALMALFVSKYDFLKHKTIGLIVLAPLIITSIVHTEVWHLGIIFLTLIFLAIITKMIEDDIIKIVLIIICIIQVPWAIETCLFDINNTISANLEMVEYLEENDYKSKTVYGIGYNVVEINPYFEKNIYSNFRTDKGFYMWNSQNNRMTMEEIYANMPDIIVLHRNDTENFKEYEDLYVTKNFPGMIFVKNGGYIDNDMFIYIRK